jgi:hypothetical protein
VISFYESMTSIDTDLIVFLRRSVIEHRLSYQMELWEIIVFFHRCATCVVGPVLLIYFQMDILLSLTPIPIVAGQMQRRERERRRKDNNNLER